MTYKFGGRNSHIKALECHLEAILSTGHQPQCYEELLRGTEVQYVTLIYWSYAHKTNKSFTMRVCRAFTCLLRAPLRSESAKSQICGDTQFTHLWPSAKTTERQWCYTDLSLCSPSPGPSQPSPTSSRTKLHQPLPPAHCQLDQPTHKQQIHTAGYTVIWAYIISET